MEVLLMFGLTPFRRKNEIVPHSRDIFDNIDTMFENFLNDSFFPSLYKNSNYMKVDIKEKENEYIVEAELPGVNKEQINIDVRNDRLTISVEQREEINEEKHNYIRRERRYGSMSRSFMVENVDEEKIKASLKNGVLTIILPKKEPNKPLGRRIEIE
jgi:HSP20 family protein